MSEKSTAVGSESEFFRLLSVGENLTIDALEGNELPIGVNDFFHIDESKFAELKVVNWATEVTLVEVYELIKDGRLAEFFASASSDLFKLCFTPAQIENFCLKHHNWLRTGGFPTLFLCWTNEEFFVVGVKFYDGISKTLIPFASTNVYLAEVSLRVVLPKLA